MSPTNCLKCEAAFLTNFYCEFCYKRLEQKIKDQIRTIEEHESYIQKQEMRILTLKTNNENTRAFLENEIAEMKIELGRR